MKFNELNVTSKKSIKRVGRGIAAGQGKTAGRGTKGQKARTGKKLRPGFAGGQNPLMQQLPKLPGFRSRRTPFENVFTGQLADLKAKTITTDELAAAGLISNAFVNVKLLNKGDVTTAIAVKLPAASAVAISSLEAAGGSFEKVARQQRPMTSDRSAKKSSRQA